MNIRKWKSRTLQGALSRAPWQIRSPQDGPGEVVVTQGSGWCCEKKGSRRSPATVRISLSSSLFLWKREPVCSGGWWEGPAEWWALEWREVGGKCSQSLIIFGRTEKSYSYTRSRACHRKITESQDGRGLEGTSVDLVQPSCRSRVTYSRL